MRVCPRAGEHQARTSMQLDRHTCRQRLTGASALTSRERYIDAITMQAITIEDTHQRID